MVGSGVISARCPANISHESAAALKRLRYARKSVSFFESGNPSVFANDVCVSLFLATLTPYFFIPQQPDNRADELKELSEDMDEALKTATDRFLNRMDEIRFWDFACIEANGLMQEYWSIRDATLLKTDDLETQAALTSIYITLSSKYSEQFQSKLETIPKLCESRLSNEELNFYYGLLKDQKPYSPFEK